MIHVKNKNFVRTVLAEGGQIKPLLISPNDSKGLGLCNPSVFIDNDEIWLILRSVNYTIYHCENGQTFNNRWGCMSYLNPENDLHLRTTNFLCKLTPELDIEKYWKIDTSGLDKEPIWEFVGLEDARLVRWDGKLYGIGVRRDTTTNGQGRMELSELEVTEKSVKEIGRYRIEHPTNPEWYCEKNWMPVLDMPYHFIKWTNPAELVKVDLETLKSWRAREVNEADKIEGLPFLRGNSQVIPWRNYYIWLVHDADLFWNHIGQKDAMYMHRFIVYDKEWNVVKIGDHFSFLGGELEFCCGIAEYEKDLLVSFGYQDNCAFILRIPEHMIPKVLGIDKIDWGNFKEHGSSVDFITNEVFTQDIYQRFFRVQEGDVVLDVGASVGPFIFHIRDQKASRIIAVEPDKRFIKTLRKNCLLVDGVEIVEKGIADIDGNFLCKGLFDGKSFESYNLESENVEVDGIKFKTLVEEKNVDKIDFLKTDSEGAEYDIFNDENFNWVMKNVKKIVGEFHLHTKELNGKWLHFRDTYLKSFKNFYVYSMDGVDIKWDVWNEHFANFYVAVMVYIDNSVKPEKWRTTKYPAIELTTEVPCPMNCAFCPQDKLVESYKGVPTLFYENFVKLIDKIPKEVHISFAGFCEPFINAGCVAMILYAHSTGHTVSIFTTGVGMNLDGLKQIRHIPFTGVQGGFVLHLPDEEGYAGHTLSDDYKQLLEAIANGEPISNFQTVTMGTLPEYLRCLFPDTIKQTMYSRAGNLFRTDVVKTANPKSKATCGCQEKIYHNVLMPNGDVVLCCQDYGLNHILGNLYDQSYEEIMPEDGTTFELCSHCENGLIV
jgi:FkbM family methyltransferase